MFVIPHSLRNKKKHFSSDLCKNKIPEDGKDKFVKTLQESFWRKTNKYTGRSLKKQNILSHHQEPNK